MTAVIKESMRIDPALSAFNRIVDEDIEIQVGCVLDTRILFLW